MRKNNTAMHDEKTLSSQLKDKLANVPATGFLNKDEILSTAIDSLREDLGLKNMSKSAFRTKMKAIAKKDKLT